MNDQGYPKFQFSVFLKNSVDGQYVVRSENKEEFELLVEYVKAKVAHETPQAPIVTPPTAPQTLPDVTPVSFGVCKQCQAPNIRYGTGTIGCSKYCWRK